MKLGSVRVMPDCAFCDSPGWRWVWFEIDGRGVKMAVCQQHFAPNNAYIEMTLWQIEEVRKALSTQEKA